MKLSELVKMVRESAGVDDPVVCLFVESDEGDLVETCEIEAILDLPTGAVTLQGIMAEGIDPCEDCGAIDDGDGYCKCPPCGESEHKTVIPIGKVMGKPQIVCKKCIPKKSECPNCGSSQIPRAINYLGDGKFECPNCEKVEDKHTTSCHKIVCDKSCSKKQKGYCVNGYPLPCDICPKDGMSNCTE